MSGRRQNKHNNMATRSDDVFSNENIEDVNTQAEVAVDLDDGRASIYTLKQEISEYLTRRERDSIVYEYYPGAETEDYDFSAERHGLYTTTLVESTSHIVKSCLGAGILSIHEAFMYGGIWTSIVGTILIGSVVGYSMHMLTKSAQIMYVKLRVHRLSYADLAEVSVASAPWRSIRKFSKPFRYSVDWCIYLEMCGTCCIYQIMIANTVKQIMLHGGGCPDVKSCLEDIRMYILIVAVPLALLSLIRSLKFLAPFSLVADIFVGICVITTLYYSVQAGGIISQRPAWKSLSGFMRFCGICLYTVDGVAVCLCVENNMRRPKYFPTVLQIAMAIVIICTTLTGFFGYWGWGEGCRSPLTIHIPVNSFTTVLQGLLAMMLCGTFAIQFWVPFKIVWHYFGRRYTKKRNIWERFYRVIHVLLITVAAILFPNLIELMVFLGNFFLGFIAFIFPAIIETLVTWPSHRPGKCRWKPFKNLLMCMVGMTLSVSACYIAFIIE